MNSVSYQEWLLYGQTIHYIFVFIGAVTFLVVSYSKRIPKNANAAVAMLFIFCIAAIGNWPDIQNSGGDKFNYYMGALDASNGFDALGTNDFGFAVLTKLCVSILPLDCYFYILALIYVGGIWLFSKSLTKDYHWLIFIAMILNFMFIAYGTNTIRAGIAMSLVLMGIASRRKFIISVILFAIAISIHKSFALPVACYLIAKYKDNTRLYFAIWLLSIPLSAVAGGFFQTWFATLIDDGRSSYLTVNALDTHYHVGFRIDFILYSCVPIFLGYYYIYKRKFQDAFYKNLYNMYILANTSWILVIRSNFSDRFAFLSWFIYSAVLIYPLLKCPHIVPNARQWLSCIVLGLTLFFAFI